jgi:glycine cleavage system aminomethyltransferase T
MVSILATGYNQRIRIFSFFDGETTLRLRQEHRACREGVVVMDMSFMSKFMVRGRDAGKCLNHLCTANIDGEVGVITYTQWLNEQGKLEADLTVTKMAQDRFLVGKLLRIYI